MSSFDCKHRNKHRKSTETRFKTRKKILHIRRVIGILFLDRAHSLQSSLGFLYINFQNAFLPLYQISIFKLHIKIRNFLIII